MGIGLAPVRGQQMPPLAPHVVVLFGATGDLARRKLLPALLHLMRSGLPSSPPRPSSAPRRQ